jgi:hypothetical protein
MIFGVSWAKRCLRAVATLQQPLGRVIALLLGLWLGLITVTALPPTALAQRVDAAPGTNIQPYLDRVAQQVTEFTLDMASSSSS